MHRFLLPPECDLDEDPVDVKVLSFPRELREAQSGWQPQSAELTAPLFSSQMETDYMRRESESRLRSKKQQLQRFHDQICLRITERQQQRRVEAQRQDKLLVR